MNLALTPSGCDLRDFQFMPMDVRRLLTSETWVTGSADEKCAAMSLWLESWQQVPAASIPNNDKMLAHLSGAGSKWKKVKDHVLRSWVDGGNGRLYHPVVAEKALEAWIEKLSAAIAGNTGNAKRWQIEIDSSELQSSLREAVEQLKVIAPRSKSLNKKTAKIIESQSLPVSPPDSLPDSPLDSGSDRNRQGQGQGIYKKEKSASEEKTESNLYVVPSRRTYEMFIGWKPEHVTWIQTLQVSQHLVKPEQFTDYTLAEFIRSNVGKDEKTENDWQRFYVNAVARGYVKPLAEKPKSPQAKQPEPEIDYSKPQNLFVAPDYRVDPEEKAFQIAEMKRIRKEQGR